MAGRNEQVRGSLKRAGDVIATLAGVRDQPRVLELFAEQVEQLHALAPGNWNLNLDAEQHFLRLNAGCLYVFEVNWRHVLVICFREDLPAGIEQDGVSFRGHVHRQRVDCGRIEQTPDCLSTLPGSIGVLLDVDHLHWLDRLKTANDRLTQEAARRTGIRANMRTAHSPAAIEYLSLVAGRALSNPDYCAEDAGMVFRLYAGLSDDELRHRAEQAPRYPARRQVVQQVAVRSNVVVAAALRQAGGVCEDCKQRAPFKSRYTGEDYLEVHHVVPLASGGADSLANVVALCPNCHRKRHHG